MNENRPQRNLLQVARQSLPPHVFLLFVANISRVRSVSNIFILVIPLFFRQTALNLEFPIAGSYSEPPN